MHAQFHAEKPLPYNPPVYQPYFYPVLLLIVPALYVDLTCSGVEKALQRLVALSGAKEPEKQTDAEPEREQCLEFGGLSALEQAAHMNDSEE